MIYFLHNLETKKDITSFDIEDEITSFHNFTCSDWVPVKIKRLSKAYNLMDKIYCPETIKMEYKRIEDGKSYGIDQPVYEFIDSIKILTTEESGNLLDIINKIKDIDLMDTPIIRLERYNDFMSDINRKLIDFTLFVCIPGKYSSDNKKFVSSSDESIISSEPTTK